MIQVGLCQIAQTFGYDNITDEEMFEQEIDSAVLAEEVGFDSVWVSDHFQPWRHHGGHAPYSLAWLGALGERTSRVTLGTSVATPTSVTTASTFPVTVRLARSTNEVRSGMAAEVSFRFEGNDDATRMFVERYYKRLLAGEGRSEALRQVQLEFLKDRALRHPYYWAAFIPIGERGPLAQGPNS